MQLKTIRHLIKILILNSASLYAVGNTEIFEAIQKRDEKMFNAALKTKPDLSARECRKTRIGEHRFSRCTSISPLHYAAMLGNEEMVRLLIENGAKVRIDDSLGLTPLHYALIANNINVVNLLLKAQADVNAKSFKPFEYDSGQGHMMSSRGKSPLHVAAGGSDLKIIQILIDNGARINEADGDGWTPLHIAIVVKRIDVIQLLISKGADLQAKTGVMEIEELRKIFPEGLTPNQMAVILTRLSKDYQPTLEALKKLSKQ